MAAHPNSISTPAMLQAAEQFEGAIRVSSATLEQARGSISSLQLAYNSEASIQLGKALHGWCREYETIIRQLSTMYGALVSNAQIYKNTDAVAQDLAQSAHMAVFSE